MRSRCRQHGIAVPGSVAATAERVDEPPLPFPVIVKPVDCGGSLMVTLARDTGEHLRACAPLGRQTVGLSAIPMADLWIVRRSLETPPRINGC